MTIFYDRNLVANIGLEGGDNVEITELRINFEVHYSATDTPTEGEITVFDVAPETADAIQSGARTVSLSGGYQEDLGLIFDGVVRRIEHEREGLERRTRIMVGGRTVIPPGRSSGNNLVNFNTAGNDVSLKDAVADVVGQLGLDLGDTSILPDIETPALYAGGIDGRTVLTQWLRGPHGIEWFEEKGVVKFSKTRAQGDGASIIDISERTGMVGTPALEFDDDGGVSVKVKTLLNPASELNSTIRIRSEVIDGSYKVVELSHIGDNWRRNRFNTEIEGVPFT